MSYYVRVMGKEDVAQITEIDREAFPTQWPPPNYQHELRNRLAHYMVACDDEKLIEPPEIETYLDKRSAGIMSGLRRLFRNPFRNELPSPIGHYIVGFTGFWVMADEAHVTSVAVREAYRRRGIGELLLIYTIDWATRLKARIVTLEVRISNTAAQSLYTRYGFTKVSVRQGYYVDRGYNIDNREDGLLMSTQDINSAAFQEQLRQLKQAHSQKWGMSISQIIP